MIEEPVVGRQNRAARVTEDGIDAVLAQAGPDDVSAAQFHGLDRVIRVTVIVQFDEGMLDRVAHLPRAERGVARPGEVPRAGAGGERDFDRVIDPIGFVRQPR